MPIKPIMPKGKNINTMKHDIYYLETSHGRVYFTVRDGLTQCDGTPTKVPEGKLLDFLAIARELGMKGGKL